MKNTIYYLDRPGGAFYKAIEEIGNPGKGEIRLKTLRTSICQSDVVIYSQGLPRISSWPAILLHEASCLVDAVGEGVTKFKVGDLVALGCDVPCDDESCIYCGINGTGDWTSCPNTRATGHELPGFAQKYSILPSWFVNYGPIMKFDADITSDVACHMEPLACNLEGLTRVRNCITNRVVVLIGAGSQSVYALQSCIAMGARKIIIVNRGPQRLQRVLNDFCNPSECSVPIEGVLWEEDVQTRILNACKPFNQPHFIMVNVSAESAYRLACDLAGYGTVIDAHAGIKSAEGKKEVLHTIDLNRDIHYKLQCYQATHGSSMYGIKLAHEYLNEHKLPLIHRMTNSTERFNHTQIEQAFKRASDRDSLKVIINWE
jgi:threonine dehydrogenase-like Zn-dependent dehydrogenase